jgi:O-succinylbenzoic acid--CoA ligase
MAGPGSYKMWNGKQFKFEWHKINWEDQENYILYPYLTFPNQLSESEFTKYTLNNEFEKYINNNFKAHIFIKTSGSLGAAKWVALSKKAILNSARIVNNHLSVSAKDKWLLTLPTNHVGGLGIIARAYLSKSEIVENTKLKWDAKKITDSIIESQTTLTSFVPTQIFDLVESAIQAPPKLRAALVGGGALNEDLYLSARKLGWPLIPSYGLTEFASQVATASLDSLNRFEFPDLEILPHAFVKINSEGRICLKGESLFTAYVYDEPELKIENLSDTDYETQDFAEIRVSKHNTELNVLVPLGRSGQIQKVNGHLVNAYHLNQELKKNFGEIKGELIFLNDERREHQLVFVSEHLRIKKCEEWIEEFNRFKPSHEKIRCIYFFERLPRTALDKIKYDEIKKKLEFTPQWQTQKIKN